MTFINLLKYKGSLPVFTVIADQFSVELSLFAQMLFKYAGQNTKLIDPFLCRVQTPASSRTASFSDNKAKVEDSPSKKANAGAPIGEKTLSPTHTHTRTHTLTQTHTNAHWEC